jgi:hypothetical protein
MTGALPSVVEIAEDPSRPSRWVVTPSVLRQRSADNPIGMRLARWHSSPHDPVIDSLGG